jgi:uncharacterized membrane protein YjdF
MNTSRVPVILFSALYLLIGGAYFLQDLNIEFVVYILVIIAVLALVFGTVRFTKLPVTILWLISLWGLLHVLGGLVQTPDGVLFAYRIYPFIDRGGEFYILKYDQVVHAFLYGVLTGAFFLIFKRALEAKGSVWVLILIAMMASMGVSAMNEIMEFLIAINLARNGVGGYENTLLDLIFNFSGACIAAVILFVRYRRHM